MRSSVVALNADLIDSSMVQFPDYEQLSSDHGRLLILIRGVGVKITKIYSLSSHDPLIFCIHFQPNKPRSLQKIFERIQKIDNVKIKGESMTCNKFMLQ